MTVGGVTWTNTYDADGMRLKRTNGTNTYSYIYNADTFASTGQGILGNSMFAYCLNNPVNYTDSKGSVCKLIFSDCFDTLKSPWQDPTGGGGSTGSRIYYTPKYGKDQKEQQVLNTLKGQGITYYNGALVVNFSSSFLSSFSIANVIFLESSQHYIDTLRHEHGHIQQQREFGAIKYLSLVFIPSATYNLISRHDSTLASCYYSMPWEYDADMRSNIQRAGHKSWAKTARDIYFWLLG